MKSGWEDDDEIRLGGGYGGQAGRRMRGHAEWRKRRSGREEDEEVMLRGG
jgi:hypothetical protein